jgi:hypothetical protein
MSDIYKQLLELINSNNPSIVPFSTVNISFSEPVVDIGDTWNTKITVSAIPSAGYVGSVDLYYNRIDIAEFGVGIWLFSDTQITNDSLIDLLNINRNAFLLVSDIEPIAIPDMVLGDIMVFPITIKNNSINWIGNNSVSTIIGFPVIAENLNILVNTVFPTNNYLE